MDPDHEAAARIALSTIRDQGFALAGGHALAMHGVGSRPSKDVDLFTDQQTDFGEAVANCEARTPRRVIRSTSPASIPSTPDSS